MAHYEIDVALLQMIKGCTLRQNTAIKYMNLAAALMVRTLWVAVKYSAANLTVFGAFNRYRVSEFASSVRQKNGKYPAIQVMT